MRDSEDEPHRLSESNAKSRLTAARAAAVARLDRWERKALASNLLGPLVVMARRLGRHELIDRGAALTYYATLSIVPGLLILFSVIGLFGTQETVDQTLSIIKDVGPTSGDTAARQPLETLIREDAESGAFLGIGIIAILWTASAYVGSFFRASASIWDVQKRPARRAWPLRMLFTITILLLLAIALLMIVLTGQLAESIGGALGIGHDVLDYYAVLKWPVLLVVVTLVVALLYSFSPSRERTLTKWRVLTPGGAIAVLAWILVSIGFEVYANAFASYNTTYGGLGTTIAGLVWLWLTNLTLLMGVELDAAIEFRRADEARRHPIGVMPSEPSALS